MNKAAQQTPTLTEKPGDIGRTTSAVDGGTQPSSPIERMRTIIEALHERRAEILAKFGLKGRVIVLGIGTRSIFGAAFRAGVVGGMPGVVVWDGPCNYETEYDKKTPNLRMGERKITLEFEHMLTSEGKPARTSFYHADMAGLGHILEGMDDDAQPVKVDFDDYLHSLEQKVEAWEQRQDAS